MIAGNEDVRSMPVSGDVTDSPSTLCSITAWVAFQRLIVRVVRYAQNWPVGPWY